MRTAELQVGANNLAAHAYRIELAGRIGELVYPPVCANCGCAASETLPVRKPFVRAYAGSDTPQEYFVGTAFVPYCGSCTKQHRREPDKLSSVRRLVACFTEGVMFAAAGSAIFALFLLGEAVGKLWTHPDGAWPLFFFAALMGSIAWGSYRSAHRGTEPFVIPAQSEITIAFDFSDDLSGPYEPERRIYTMRNERFAAESAALNRGRIWDAQGPPARRARALFWITVGVIVLAAVAMS